MMSSHQREPESGAPGDTRDIYAELYRELRALAHGRLSRGSGPGLLATTSLVHESYLRLLAAERPEFENRNQFLAYAARVMRSVIVDLARERASLRRGSGQLIPLTTGIEPAKAADDEEVLGVHQALDRLAELNERMAQVVETRYFGGLSESEIGQAIGITERTVRRDWEKARIVLAAMLK